MSETKKVESVVESLFANVVENQSDWHFRSILADWYDDHNVYGEAECYRWMVTNRKRPYNGSPPNASWFNDQTVAPGLGDSESDIPEEVYKVLDGGKVTANHRTYPSIEEAEKAFLIAFLKARKEGWDGTIKPRKEEAKVKEDQQPESDE